MAATGRNPVQFYKVYTVSLRDLSSISPGERVAAPISKQQLAAHSSPH